MKRSSKNMALEKFKAKVCSCCGQTEEYIISLDAGAADIVMAIAAAIRKKGENKISPRNEMEISKKQMNEMGYNLMVKEGYLTSNMVGNLSKARSHGLIARVESGSYCLTTKGADFLKGAPVPRHAIISKTTGHNIGYWHEFYEKVTIKELMKSGCYWEIDFTIRESRIFIDAPRTLAFQF